MDLQQPSLQGSSQEISSQLGIPGVPQFEGVTGSRSLSEELEIAVPDIAHFQKRLSSIIGSDAVAMYGGNLAELMGYSRECGDCMVDNGLLEDTSRGTTIQ